MSGYVKGAFESIPGNETNSPTLSTKVLYLPATNFEPKLAPKFLDRQDEIRAIDEPLALTPDSFEPSWDAVTRGYPDTLGFLYKLALGAPVTTAGNGVITDPDGTTVPVGCYKHVWTAPFGPAGTSPMTAEFIIAYLTQSAFFKMKGAAVDKLGLSWPAEGGMQVKASGPGLYLTKIADPSLTPSYESMDIPPFTRGNMSIVTWLGSTGETEDFDLNIDCGVSAQRTLATASMFPDQMDKTEEPITFTGSMPKRVFATADWDALVAGTGFAVKVKWISTKVIASGYKYGMWYEAPNAQYTEGGPNALVNARRYGGSFNWKATSTGAAGSSKLTLINATASYV